LRRVFDDIGPPQTPAIGGQTPVPFKKEGMRDAISASLEMKKSVEAVKFLDFKGVCI
jgi:hypothetical protein